MGGLGRDHMGDRERLYYCGRERLHRGDLRRFQMCGRVEFHKECLRGLHGFRLDRFCDNTLRYAFSLIELSIVLIIIGLLVAGVTGGKSLIESAKQRAFINELNGWKRSFYTFYAAQGRLPGDLNNDGIIGRCYGLGCPGVSSETSSTQAETYTTSSFPAPYNTKVPSDTLAVLIDLYLNKIIDCQPDPNDSHKKNCLNSKVYKEPIYNYIYTVMNYKSGANTCVSILPSLFKPNDIILRSRTYSKIPVKSMKAIDEKIDDGKSNSGNFMGFLINGNICYYVSNYDYWIKNKDYYWDEMYFKLYP